MTHGPQIDVGVRDAGPFAAAGPALVENVTV